MTTKQGAYYKKKESGKIYTLDCVAVMSIFEKNVSLAIIHETGRYRTGNQRAIAMCDFQKNFIEVERPVDDDE